MLQIYSLVDGAEDVVGGNLALLPVQVPTFPISCRSRPVPRPIVDSNCCEGRLKAIGQGTDRAKPLPRTAYGQRKL